MPWIKLTPLEFPRGLLASRFRRHSGSTKFLISNWKIVILFFWPPRIIPATLPNLLIAAGWLRARYWYKLLKLVSAAKRGCWEPAVPASPPAEGDTDGPSDHLLPSSQHPAAWAVCTRLLLTESRKPLAGEMSTLKGEDANTQNRKRNCKASGVHSDINRTTVNIQVQAANNPQTDWPFQEPGLTQLSRTRAQLLIRHMRNLFHHTGITMCKHLLFCGFPQKVFSKKNVGRNQLINQPAN